MYFEYYYIRENKIVKLESNFDEEDRRELSYDKLLICAGPWTNRILGPSVMSPPMSQLPLVVSNEQTQDFSARLLPITYWVIVVIQPYVKVTATSQ